MEAMVKSFTGFFPFIDQYPTWVRVLVSGWVLYTAAILVVLIVAPRSSVQLESVVVVLRIAHPLAGVAVGQSDIVRGASPLAGLNHYLIVIPLQTGDRYVVDGPLSIDAEGNWSGRARFGEGNVGVGERFAVSVLATAVTLPEGQLDSLPADSYVSDSVEVVRSK